MVDKISKFGTQFPLFIQINSGGREFMKFACFYDISQTVKMANIHQKIYLCSWASLDGQADVKIEVLWVKESDFKTLPIL